MNVLKIIVNKDISLNIINSLHKLGFTVMRGTENKNLLPGLTSHPDMQIAFVGSTAVCEPELYEFYLGLLSSSTVTLRKGKTSTKCNYPKDIAYNIKVVGNKIFHNFKHTDAEITNVMGERTPINVSQGYSGCSICKVGDNAIITADTVIHSRALKNSVDSLLITPGHIALPPFEYGFIGGASFYSDGVVYFFGDVTRHPNYGDISKFCSLHASKIHCLDDGILYDYGSAFTFE